MYNRPCEASPKGCPKFWVFEAQNRPFPCPISGFLRPKFIKPCPDFGFLREILPDLFGFVGDLAASERRPGPDAAGTRRL